MFYLEVSIVQQVKCANKFYWYAFEWVTIT